MLLLGFQRRTVRGSEGDTLGSCLMPSADAQPEEAALAPVSARVFALFERDVALCSQTEIVTPAAAWRDAHEARLAVGLHVVLTTLLE